MARAAVAAIGISVVLNTIGVFTEDEIHWVNLLIGAVVAVVAALVVFGLLVRRVAGKPSEAAWWGVGLGLFGIFVAGAAFWSQLPPVLGLAAIYLGRTAWGDGTKGPSRTAIAAVVLGILTVLADVAAYAADVATRY
ncbi:MAG: hypothetical protein ACJ74D_11520 [Gaiellaceae bacterium]